MNSLLLYIGASLAVIIIPGPDLIYVLIRGISGGKNQGLISAAGVSTGILFHSAAAALGLSVLLQNIPAAFSIIRISGGLYLSYLGIRTILSKNSFLIEGEMDGKEGSNNHWKCFFQGFLSNVLNPKIILFFLAFLPQFVDMSDEHSSINLLLRGILFAVITLFLYASLGLFSGTLGSIISRNGKQVRVIQVISGLILISLALMIVFLK